MILKRVLVIAIIIYLNVQIGITKKSDRNAIDNSRSVEKIESSTYGKRVEPRGKNTEWHLKQPTLKNPQFQVTSPPAPVTKKRTSPTPVIAVAAGANSGGFPTQLNYRGGGAIFQRSQQ